MTAALNPFDYSPSRRLHDRVKRRLTQWRVVRPITSLPKASMITFTFDDFPVSSVTAGGDALAPFDISATYYACSGLAGEANLTGELYTEEHLDDLKKAGHDIAAHTDTHLDCAASKKSVVIADIQRNLDWLQMRGIETDGFAYPYGETTVELKRELKSNFSTARGILPGINRKGSDLTQLRAIELTPEDWTHRRAEAAIETVSKIGGWLIFFTHDVRETPSPFGVQPGVLKKLARQSRDSGADLVNMRDASALLERSRT